MRGASWCRVSEQRGGATGVVAATSRVPQSTGAGAGQLAVSKLLQVDLMVTVQKNRPHTMGQALGIGPDWQVLPRKFVGLCKNHVQGDCDKSTLKRVCVHFPSLASHVLWLKGY